MSTFVFKKEVSEYIVITRFGKMKGEQFEVRLKRGETWIGYLNFRHPEATPVENHRNSRGIPELFVPPEQYLGVIDLLRNESPIWFTLYEEPLAGWLSTNVEPTGPEDENG